MRSRAWFSLLRVPQRGAVFQFRSETWHATGVAQPPPMRSSDPYRCELVTPELWAVLMNDDLTDQEKVELEFALDGLLGAELI